MQRAEISARLTDITRAAHDREPEQTAPRGARLTDHYRGQPEQDGRQGKPIAQELRSCEPKTIGELAEDAEGTETYGRADDERHAHCISIPDGCGHRAILE